MRLIVSGILALAAAGCVTPSEDIPAAGEDSRFACATTGLGGMVGQTASTAVGAEAMRAANARTIRWIRPGDIVTMDHRTDRLNIDLDVSNRITAFRCG
jgi:dihydroxyacid dehydratase/phosphogluconate dehydratase